MPSEGLRTYVEAIPGEPLPHGLLTGCTNVLVADDPHELLGTEWRPLSCADAHDTTWCPPGDPAPEVPAKQFDRLGTCSAAPVAIYAGAECSAPGFTFAEARAQAAESLALGAQRALEEWFMRTVLCDIADDLTPAEGALSIAQGLAALETWLGTEYGGRGVIHVPVGAGALMGPGNLIRFVDGQPETLVGNCVIFGAGYSINIGPPDCTVADPGEAWLYATSPILVRTEEANLIPDEDRQSVDILTNDRRVLVEQTYVVEIACCRAAAVRVKLC